MFSTLIRGHRLSAVEQDLSRDQVFHLLRNRRRRFTLHFLKQVEHSKIGAIAEQVAAWENGVSPESVSAIQRKRVYNSLQQTHLPELEDSGLITYDARSGDVELTNVASLLDGYLHASDHFAIYWSVYTLGLSSVGVATVIMVQLGLYPPQLLRPYGMLAFIVVTLTVSSLAHVLLERQHRSKADIPPPDAGYD